jgi:hypothetical protein
MTESPQQPKEQQEIIKSPFVKLSTKFVQGFKEWGAVVHTDTARSYFFPVAVIKHSASPVGVYQLVDFKDLPDELLAKFGLQKIPAKLPQYRAFRSGELIEDGDKYIGEDGVSLEDFHPSAIGKLIDDGLTGDVHFLKLVKNPGNGEEA